MKSKLCCMLNPEVRCIGCDTPLCEECYVDTAANHHLQKCNVVYYQNWTHDKDGHAFNDADTIQDDRDWEADGKAKRKGCPLRLP